jgi:hypothetical protein
MPYAIKPLSCDPARIKGMSERLIISHYENNYSGAVKRLNAIDEQLAQLEFDKAAGSGISTGYITIKTSPACSRSDQPHSCVEASGPRDAPPFRVVLLCAFTVTGTFIGGSGGASAQSQDAALRLEAKIPLGDVRGRIDHMAADINRRRLFVAELGNNTVGIVDVGQGKVLQTLGGLKEPQGVGYLSSIKHRHAVYR